MGLSKDFISWIKFLYSAAVASVVTNDLHSCFVTLKCGTKKGSVCVAHVFMHYGYIPPKSVSVRILLLLSCDDVTACRFAVLSSVGYGLLRSGKTVLALLLILLKPEKNAKQKWECYCMQVTNRVTYYCCVSRCVYAFFLIVYSTLMQKAGLTISSWASGPHSWLVRSCLKTTSAPDALHV